MRVQLAWLTELVPQLAGRTPQQVADLLTRAGIEVDEIGGLGALALGAADRASAVAAVKARLRIASADEDALIAAFAESALGLAEQITGQATVARPMVQAVTGIGGWMRLGVRPVAQIAAVDDAQGNPLPVGDYAIDIDDDGIGWVRLATGVRARVGFTAGLADGWEGLPAALRDGAAMLAAHLFDDRTGGAPVPAAVTALWRPFRTMRLGLEVLEVVLGERMQPCKQHSWRV